MTGTDRRSDSELLDADRSLKAKKRHTQQEGMQDYYSDSFASVVPLFNKATVIERTTQ